MALYDLQVVCPRCKSKEKIKNVDIKKRVCKRCGCSFNSHTGEINAFEDIKNMEDE